MSAASRLDPEALPARASGIALSLLPGAVTIYFAFQSGGYYATNPAATAIILLAVLLVRFMIMPRPMGGFNRLLGVGAAGLAAFTAWVLLSATWSDAPSRALTEFDRTLVYLLAFVIFGSAGGEVWRLRWLVRGMAIATVVICAAAVITRILPALWPISYVSISSRLSYPLSYWNALGLIAGLGIVFCVGITADEREPPLARVLGAAALPLLSCALLLTLSRGAIAAVALGLVIYAIVGRPRALITGLIAVVPTSLIVVATTYHAKLVVSDLVMHVVRPGLTLSRAAVQAGQSEGRHVALVLVLCILATAALRALLLPYDETVGFRLSPQARRRLVIAGAAVVVAGLVAAAVKVDLPRAYDNFTAATPQAPATGETELTTVNNHERVAQWRAAFDQFKLTPIIGRGAGTFELTWDRYRPDTSTLINDPVYPEELAELGIVGIVFFAVFIVTILVGLTRRARGPNRASYAALLAACGAWLLAAAVDYHWDIPADTFWLCAAAGTALASPTDPAPRERYLAWAPRIVVGIVCCVVAIVVPVRVYQSQHSLDAAFNAYPLGQCGRVSSDAADSISAIGGRPQPYVLTAACALLDGLNTEAVANMRKAITREPDNALYYYGLAVALARSGLDPRAAMATGLRLSPREPLLLQAAMLGLNRHKSSQGWRLASRTLQISVPAPT